jgi:phospholipid transport system substrate-binding protein
MPFIRSAFTVLLVVFAVCGVTTRSAHAQSATPATEYVQKMGDRAIIELTAKNVSDSERVKRMRALLKEYFDVTAVSQFVLGTYWRQATEDERQEFMKLYEVVVAHTYAGLFKKYSGEQFKVQRERAVDDGATVVYSQIIQPSGGEPVAVEVTVKKGDGDAFKAIDIKVEGISMPLTHRKEYASVIQRNRGVAGLLKVLKQKADSLEAENPSQ